jgi:guanylate kinase
MGNASSAEVQTSQDHVDNARHPYALVIVGPSGVGKGTLIEKLREGNDDFGFSCSHTTRNRRPGEEDGVHYHFISREEFENGISKGKFLEYAYVHNNIYGTSIEAVQAVASSGKCCILDIDVQGARQVRASGLPAIFVFIGPPSLEELEHRLRNRGTESEEQITTRLRNAKEELASVEEPGLYDYVLINTNLQECLAELRKIAAKALSGVGLGTVDRTVTGSSTRNGMRGEAAVRETDPGSQTASLIGWLGEGEGGPTTTDSFGGLERWKQSVALVIGATSKVGNAIVLALASAGLRVVAVARQKSQLELLQQQVSLNNVPPASFLPVVCDVTKEAEVAALPRIIERRWEGCGIDVLINALGSGASRMEPTASLASGSAGTWVEVVSSTIIGTALVTREVVRSMRQREKWGHLIYLNCTIDGAAGIGMAKVALSAADAMVNEIQREVNAAGWPIRTSRIATGPLLGDSSGRGSAGGLTTDDCVRSVLYVLSTPSQVDVTNIQLMAFGERTR